MIQASKVKSILEVAIYGKGHLILSKVGIKLIPSIRGIADKIIQSGFQWHLSSSIEFYH